MAADPKKTSDENNEFADFMADISQEIAQRVGSLDVVAAPPVTTEEKRTNASSPPEGGSILDWENVADRMMEEML